MKHLLYLSLVLIVGWACQPAKESANDDPKYNPPAEGFNSEDSDPAAIELADSIMMAMGLYHQ